MKTIINADDFGYSKTVNQAVAECFHRGVINRTTLMVNMPEAENAAALAEKNGFFHRVGLHINLTEGPAMSDESRQSELCNENGFLLGRFHVPIAARFFLNSDISRAIEAETRAQILKYIEMGFSLMHADSHNYTHTYFSVARVVNPLLSEYRFTSVRISRNIPPENISLLFRPYKFFYNKQISKLAAGGKKVYTTKYFGDVADFEAYVKTRTIDGDLELMTHPTFGQDGVLLDTDKPMITKEWLFKHAITLS